MYFITGNVNKFEEAKAILGEDLEMLEQLDERGAARVDKICPCLKNEIQLCGDLFLKSYGCALLFRRDFHNSSGMLLLLQAVLSLSVLQLVECGAVALLDFNIFVFFLILPRNCIICMINIPLR